MVILFSSMDWITILALSLGMGMIIVEMFLPGFGIFGILGIGFLLTGMIMQAVNTTSGSPLAQFCILLVIIAVVLSIVFVIFAVAVRKGKFAKSFLFKEESALPEDMSDVTYNYNDLVGKSGTVVTTLRPIGVAEIDGKRYDVMTESQWLQVGSAIRVTGVDGSKITVEPLKEGQTE